MGAYYKAVDMDNMVMFDNIGFLKLGEHSYLYNDYVAWVIDYIKKQRNSVRLVWMCDYHEPDGVIDITYFDDSLRKKKPTKKILKKYDSIKFLKSFYKDIYINNITKGEAINMSKLIEMHETGDTNRWTYHPLPILTASDTEPMGGGDIDSPVKGIWRGDIITITRKSPYQGCEDKTEYYLFYFLHKD